MRFNKIALLTGLIVTVFLASCTKTEYEHTKYPYKEIKRFSIKGFFEGDSITGVITGNEILVYWDQAVPLPESITPAIIISDRASISPASGETVAVTGNTVFTVTAEDASTQTYSLKFILQQPDPIVLSAPNAPHLQWINGAVLGITGQYFLAGGDPSSIRVFARRLSDGVEFDLKVDPEYTTSVSLRAELPEFTAASDTGRHDIKLTIGQKTIDVAQGSIKAPALLSSFFSFTNTPATLSAGDDISLQVDDKMNGEIYKFYKERFSAITVWVTKESIGSYQQFELNDFERTGNTLKFKFPASAAAYAGHDVTMLDLHYPDPSHWQGFQIARFTFSEKNITVK